MNESSNAESYRICTRSVMDNIADQKISFDENGVCNYWYETEKKMKSIQYTEEQCQENIKELIKNVKALRPPGSEYDCLIGVSGGVDSSYLAYLVHEWGLKPLVVHFDNGWNSELSVQNIHNLISILDFEFYTYVIDWQEFRDLQRSFFKASVVDVEMLTDHAISAAMFNIARENNIKVVLGGSNTATESFFPDSWSWLKSDLTNIRSIQKKYGTLPMSTFPTMGLVKRKLLEVFPRFGLTFFTPLDLINYKKNDAMKLLEAKLEWKYYGGKHYESVFTKFYQAYYLPEKFKIDKRKPHLSCLIINNEMTREEALIELKKPLYEMRELESEKLYVLKKLGFSESEWNEIMTKNPVSHDSFQSEITLYRNMRPFINIYKRLRRK